MENRRVTALLGNNEKMTLEYKLVKKYKSF